MDEQYETMEIIVFLSRQRCESTRSGNDCEIMFQGLISKARIKSFSSVFFSFPVDDLRAHANLIEILTGSVQTKKEFSREIKKQFASVVGCLSPPSHALLIQVADVLHNF